MGSEVERILPSKDTILVVGTGISLGLTNGSAPQLSWKGLIENGLNHAAEIGKISTETAKNWINLLGLSTSTAEILTLASFLTNSLSTGGAYDYGNWLKKEFSEIKITNNALALTIKRLSDAGIKICTLNYDSLLEDVTNLPAVHMTDTEEVIEWFKGERKGILHLHGHWMKPETCILSSEDYNFAVESTTRGFFQQRLTVFEKLIFVGCGGTFEDPNFSKTLSWLRDELKSKKLSTYALVKNSEVADRRKDPAWKNIVQPVGFGEENSCLGSFLDKLFNKVINKDPREYPDLQGNAVIQSMEQGHKAASLDGIQVYLPMAPHAHNVRHSQSFQAEQILNNHRCLWLAADWGMEEDEFLSALLVKISKSPSKIYSVNIGNYSEKASFYNQIEELVGVPFESFCVTLAGLEQPYLILRDVPLDTSDEKDRLQADLLGLAEILTSFCPNLKVVLVSRHLPAWRNGSVELTALSGADTRAYIESHALYQGGLGNDDFTQVFEHTNGVPKIIKEALNKLAVASLEDIISERGSSRMNLSGRFGDSIKALSTAGEIEKKYAYSLLRSLAAFPFGEYLENIRRVDKTKKYLIDHVVILQREGFIYVEDQDTFGVTGSRASKKRLIVTRPVRQWLAQEMKPRELAKIKSQAYQLYFGDSWETADPKLHHIFKANDIDEKSSEINNAKYFITEIFIEAKTNERWRSVGMDLASQFCVSVSKRSYYKVVQGLYVALRPMLESWEKDRKYWFFIYQCARSIRMSSEKADSDEALKMFLGCLDHIKEPSLMGSIKLNIAMIYSEKDRSKALDFANQAQKLSKGTIALHAKHVALINSDVANKQSDVMKIQSKAKTSAATLYATIALRHADELEGTEKIEMLQNLVEYCHSHRDLYNEIRATLCHADAVMAQKGSLEHKEISTLISIYHHLHQDNLKPLHSQCHRILWSAFEVNKDYLNLFQLFKYSSLYWRLRDEQKPELAAIKRFKSLQIPSTFPERDPTVSYYYGRISTIEGQGTAT